MAEEVVNNQADNHLLMPMIKEVVKTVGEAAKETVADAGYYSPDQLKKAENEKVGVLVNISQDRDATWNKGNFAKSNFSYCEEKDVFICPLGKKLVYEQTRFQKGGRHKVLVYRCKSHKECKVRSQCSRIKQGRVIEKNENYPSIKRQEEKQKDLTKKILLKQRKTIVEPAFAHIKEQHGFRRFAFRGLHNVRGQWSMICTAINLNKLLKYWQKRAPEFS